ncbi:sugar phosphate isomerase/epimerase family protein [Paenibacillus sp. GCM10023252]|uniref:sugar phosphate isomerase/epimerase family protein n=1 Tax=Paenibacillus sp. GCM10023252 TaxID=3252649 RepID=UPI0036076AB8
MTKLNIGLQLYTVRDATSEDFEGTLRQVAAMGYEGVEFAGYGDVPAEKMRDLLKELNLTAIGAHLGFQQLEEDIEAQIAYLQTIGAKYAVCPYLAVENRGSEEAWIDVIERLEAIGKRMHEAGISFGYHNHAFEFEDQLDGGSAFDAIYSRTAPEHLHVEMDIGWVQYAGNDPLAYIAKYKGRLPLLHLKDFRKANSAVGSIDTVELGQGDLPLTDIIKSAEAADVEWIIVEQDSCANPPMESVATSINWLKQNYLQSV